MDALATGGAPSHAGGSLATRRGGGVSSFGAAHGGAGGARKCGRTMKSQGGLGRLARGEARRCSRSKACCTNDGGPTRVGDRSDGRMCPAGPEWGRMRWRVTIATSRFSRRNEASIRSTPRGTGPRPWLLDRRRPAGRQRPQVREECPLPESPPSIEIAALKRAISRHAAAKALALAGLTSNLPSSSLAAPRSFGDGGTTSLVNSSLRGSSIGDGEGRNAPSATQLPVKSKRRGPCIGT